MSASPDRLVAGLIGDRYEITGLIASGGMGAVYRARDIVLDRIVALKVLKGGGDDADFVARFKTEATNAARLSHPNIVQVYDFGYANGQPYMAMEYVDGQNLREILSSRGSLRPDLAASIALQVAQALEHARRNGLMHRDIKPENILVTTEGQVKVADFGLSRAMAESRATQAGILMGTAQYLAPEQVSGETIDHRADVYALGVVLFEMLTGRAPFGGDSPVVIAYKRVAEDVPSPMGINPGVPRELDVVVSRATARDPSGRYSTAGAMAEALRASAPRSDTGDIGGLVHHTQAIPIVGEETIAVPRSGAKPPKTKHRITRRRWVALLLLLAFIATVAFAVAGRTQTVAVPKVFSLSQSDATRLLEARGLKVNPVVQNDPNVQPGFVISQNPPAGVKIAKGKTVTITVSLGPALIPLPDVRNLLYKQAESILIGKGFKVERLDAFSDTVPKLKVIDQQPGAGVPLQKNAKVTLTVSKGKEVVKVPDVVGDPQQSAINDLQTAGFTVVEQVKYDNTVPKGNVISVSPKAGTELKKGSTVTIVVSNGAPLVVVPNVLCMTRRQAADTLAHAGLKANFQGLQGSNKRVVDQRPVANAKAPKGSAVDLVMGYGSTC